MNTQIRIEDRTTQSVLEIAAEVAMWKIPKTLADGFTRLKQQIEVSGGEMVGAPYARYLGLDWDEVRTEGALSQFWHLVSRKQQLLIGMPFSGPVEASGNMKPGSIVAGRYVTGVHRGALHKIGGTYKAIAGWAAKQDISLRNSAVESYVTDPGEVATDDLETLIFIQVAS